MVISSLAARKRMSTCEVCRTFWQKLKPEPSARETSGTGRSYGPAAYKVSASARVQPPSVRNPAFPRQGHSADKADILFQPEKFCRSGSLFGII